MAKNSSIQLRCLLDNGRRATQRAQRQLVAGLVQHCSKVGATYHPRYAKKHRRFEMSGSFRVEFRNKYGRIRRAHMSASPRLSQFDVSIFYLYHYGTEVEKNAGLGHA